jgi:hypothetical protein
VKSNKQRRAEIQLRRRERAEKKVASRKPDPSRPRDDIAPCNPALLAPYNSYGQPPFVERGYYVDEGFQCAGCQSPQNWRATQQKWWYEVAKGNVESRAKYCRACRRAERERSAEARRVHLDGVARKAVTRRKS